MSMQRPFRGTHAVLLDISMIAHVLLPDVEWCCVYGMARPKVQGCLVWVQCIRS